MFVWTHAQTCSSSHLHISKNTQMDPCEYIHRHIRVHRGTHVVMNSQICFNAPWVGSSIRKCPRHAQIHKCTCVPMWDGMQRCAWTHGDWCGRERLDSLRHAHTQRSAQLMGAHTDLFRPTHRQRRPRPRCSGLCPQGPASRRQMSTEHLMWMWALCWALGTSGD